MSRAPSFPAEDQSQRSGSQWRQAAVALLAVRCTQGFVFWGGGSRRFIYDPEKLDPGAHDWMATKFQSAMPGGILGTDRLIAFLLEHFWILYPALIAFSAAELVAGVALFAGLMTRLAALATIVLSVGLMLMFGWQGGTCLDEWTMASATLAMGTTLFIAGGGVPAVDNFLLQRRPSLAGRRWFAWAGGALPLPLDPITFRRAGLACIAAVLAFNVGTYSYYRGSVVTPFHSGRVSPTVHHFSLSDGRLAPDGSVRFRIKLDGGTPDVPAHVLKAEVAAADGRILETWDHLALSRLPAEAIRNRFAYNRFATGPYGLVARMGAEAVITLPRAADAPSAADFRAGGELRLTNVEGTQFTAKLAAADTAE